MYVTTKQLLTTISKIPLTLKINPIIRAILPNVNHDNTTSELINIKITNPDIIAFVLAFCLDSFFRLSK